MKTNPTSLLRVVVVLAMLGSQARAQQTEAEAEAVADGKSRISIEVNGKKIGTDGSGGTITLRSDGDEIEIDDDGKAGDRVKKSDAADKIAWLGVKNTAVSPELASQLDLEGGAVVEMVMPDSPADRAGLQEYDIITAIGDRTIKSPEELASAIRAKKPGAKVGFSVIRKSKPLALTATLGNRPQMPKNQQAGFHDLQLNGNPEDMRVRIEKIQREMLNGMKLRINGANLPDIGAGGDIVHMSSKSTSFSDGNGSITVTTKNGSTQIEAKDADGNLLYKGPAETEDDRNNLPPEVLEKLERFETMKVDIDTKGFEKKVLPPALDLPEPKPAEPNKEETSATIRERSAS